MFLKGDLVDNLYHIYTTEYQLNFSQTYTRASKLQNLSIFKWRKSVNRSEFDVTTLINYWYINNLLTTYTTLIPQNTSWIHFKDTLEHLNFRIWAFSSGENLWIEVILMSQHWIQFVIMSITCWPTYTTAYHLNPFQRYTTTGNQKESNHFQVENKSDWVRR